MKFDILICQYDLHNQSVILLSKKFKIKEIVILNDEDKAINKSEYNDTYTKVISDLKIEYVNLELGNRNKVEEILEGYKLMNPLICLNGGDRVNSLLLLEYSLKFNMFSIYLDILKKKRYIFGSNSRIIEQALDDLDICDITNLSGASILEDSSELCKKDDIKKITEKILLNMEIWHKNKQILYNNNIFIHDFKDTSRVAINIELLNEEQNKLLDKCLIFLKSLGGIEYNQNNKDISVFFKNNYLKGFIFKSGTWLEVLTNNLLEEISEIDEVRNSVIFIWSEAARRVKNELDVVAIKDSILICVSCKDSDKYDEDALNELEVYSKKIGGENAIKILVATKLPVKRAVIDRAKEMNINLVIVDKDLNKFKGKIMNIIKK